MKIFTLSVFLVTVTTSLFSQLSTSVNGNPQNLVQQIFLGYGISINSVNYTGYADAFGFFSYSGDHFPVHQGLIMTTGTILGAGGPHGPNDIDGAGIYNSAGNCPILNSLLGADLTYNAAILEIDFTSMGDTIFFNYSFASEEYLEYVNSEFNDIFGLFISGPGISGEQNIALLPDMNFVSINNVNSTENSSYYIDNGDGSSSPFNSDPSYIQYDGFTTRLTARSAVIPGESYHLTIAIADVYDGAFDSGIFLEAQSLKSNYTLSTGVEQPSTMQLYPNPASSKVYFKLPYENSFTAEITNFQGKKIGSDYQVGNAEPLDISFLENGIYFLEITTPIGKMMQKIVKQ